MENINIKGGEIQVLRTPGPESTPASRGGSVCVGVDLGGPGVNKNRNTKNRNRRVRNAKLKYKNTKGADTVPDHSPRTCSINNNK